MSWPQRRTQKKVHGTFLPQGSIPSDDRGCLSGRRHSARSAFVTDCLTLLDSGKKSMSYSDKRLVSVWQMHHANFFTNLFFTLKKHFLQDTIVSQEEYFLFSPLPSPFSMLFAAENTGCLCNVPVRFPFFAGKKKGQLQALYSLCCPKCLFHEKRSGGLTLWSGITVLCSQCLLRPLSCRALLCKVRPQPRKESTCM